MKIKIAAILSAFALLWSDAVASADDAQAELKALVSKVQAKLKDDKRTEADLAPELKEFDELLAKHKGEKTDDVAQILMMKAMLYAQVMEDYDKATEAVKQLKSDFPDTKQGQQADATLKSFAAHAAAEKIQKALVVGTAFPDFSEQDLNGKPLSVANYKGKVVMVDFWATWCGPCRAELPNVVKTYQAHHEQGFEIIGVSLDRDKDKEKLVDFIGENKMPWAQYFDGGYWTNKLAVKYGIQSIPATFLLDGNGNIIGKGLRGEELESAVSKALAAK
jgi:thiol-disulfide isomerase/thioredoxin